MRLLRALRSQERQRRLGQNSVCGGGAWLVWYTLRSWFSIAVAATAAARLDLLADQIALQMIAELTIIWVDTNPRR